MIRYLVIHSLISASILLLLRFWPQVKPRIRFWLAMVGLLIWLLPLPTLTLPFTMPEDTVTYQLWVGGMTQLARSQPDESFGIQTLTAMKYLLQWLFAGLIAAGLVRLICSWRTHQRSLIDMWRDSQALPWSKSDSRLAKVRLRSMPGMGAMTTGWRRPVIWVGNQHIGQASFDALLTHELTHIRQGDNLYVYFIHVLECLGWWHPIVVKLAQEARFCLELSCDDRCKQQLGQDDYRHSLAEIMLQVKGLPLPTTHMSSAALGNDANNMRRLKALAQPFVWQAHHRAGLLLTSIVCLALTIQPQNQLPSGSPTTQPNVPVRQLSQVDESAVPRVGADGVEPPVILDRPNLTIPPEAVAAGVQGYLILEAIMRKSGVVEDVTVLRGIEDDHYGIAAAAVAALKKWQFKPGTYQGAPADLRMTVKISIVP